MKESPSDSMHQRPARPPAPSGPGPLARLIAFIVSAGLAWALAVAVMAWLIGLVVTRG